MLSTFIVCVENKAGVLNRVLSLFRQRGFNIESLILGRAEHKGTSRITMVVEGEDDQARRVEASLYKLIDVILVENLTAKPTVRRNFAIIKVGAAQEERCQLLELTTVFRARVLDLVSESVIIEITDTEEQIDALIEVLRPFGVLEVVRTGIILRSTEKPNIAEQV
jgi:acetolactate synthase-1/3 small subunit